MKIAITSQGPDPNAAVDPRFGRANYFVVCDTATGVLSFADNHRNLNAPQGAGIQAGANVVELGVQAIITGHVGPKAFDTLRAGNVAVYTVAGGTVAEAIDRFKAGQLKRQADADVEGHRG
jgi:predicted Fe-Mo cluster-binding NifX family protein